METKTSVLLIEDEKTLAKIIYDALTDQGYNVEVAYDGIEGLKKYTSSTPDIIITDIMMPNLDGFSVVKEIRTQNASTKILFLTARNGIEDVVKGFEIGGNDYLKKPFAIVELLARVKELTNRTKVSEPQKQTIFKIKDYEFNSINNTLKHGNQTIELPNRESQILLYLCLNKNNIVSSKTMLIELWGDDNYFNTRSLNVFITKLRHRFNNDIQIINVRGVGYKLIE